MGVLINLAILALQKIIALTLSFLRGSFIAFYFPLFFAILALQKIIALALFFLLGFFYSFLVYLPMQKNHCSRIVFSTWYYYQIIFVVFGKSSIYMADTLAWKPICIFTVLLQVRVFNESGACIFLYRCTREDISNSYDFFQLIHIY